MAQTAFRTCPLCEATCGLELTLDESGTGISRVRGDADDVFSHGFLCPKGVALKELHEDPGPAARAAAPAADGSFEACSWDDAFAGSKPAWRDVVSAGGRNAVAVYLGNPNAHNLSALLYARPLVKALGTRNLYSASTVDQYPKQLASGLMFGTASTVAVPDLDRCAARDDPRRRSGLVQRLAHDGARRARAAAGGAVARRAGRRRGPAAVAHRAERRRRARLHPAGDRCAAADGDGRGAVLARGSCGSAGSSRCARASTRSGRWPRRSPLSAWRGRPACPSRSCDGSPRSSRPRTAASSTAGWARRRRRSARSRRGSSTCSTR